MEITYVYDPEVETYRRIVEEYETSYLVSNYLGVEYHLDKLENPDLKTLTIAPVGTQVYHKEYKVYGVIDKLDINDWEQPCRVRWNTQDDHDDFEPWPKIEQIVLINY